MVSSKKTGGVSQDVPSHCHVDAEGDIGAPTPNPFAVNDSFESGNPPLVTQPVLPVLMDTWLLGLALKPTKNASLNLGNDWALTYKGTGDRITLAWLPSHEQVMALDLVESARQAVLRYHDFEVGLGRAWSQNTMLSFLKPDLFLSPAFLSRMKDSFDVSEKSLTGLMDQVAANLLEKGNGTLEALVIKPEIFEEIMGSLMQELHVVAERLNQFFPLVKRSDQEKSQILAAEIHDFNGFPNILLNFYDFWLEDLRAGTPIDVTLLTRASSLGEVFKRIGAERKHAAGQKHIHLYLTCDDAVADLTTANSGKLKLVRRILTNFLTNSIKYHRAVADGLALQVEIQASLEVDTVKFRITDNGLGMSADDLARYGTERAFRAEATRQTHKGNGEGIYACFRTIERWGGKVTKQSTLGEGTTVAFKLPLKMFKNVAAAPKFLPQAEPVVMPAFAKAPALPQRRLSLRGLAFWHQPQAVLKVSLPAGLGLHTLRK